MRNVVAVVNKSGGGSGDVGESARVLSTCRAVVLLLCCCPRSPSAPLHLRCHNQPPRLPALIPSPAPAFCSTGVILASPRTTRWAQKTQCSFIDKASGSVAQLVTLSSHKVGLLPRPPTLPCIQSSIHYPSHPTTSRPSPSPPTSHHPPTSHTSTPHAASSSTPCHTTPPHNHDSGYCTWKRRCS